MSHGSDKKQDWVDLMLQALQPFTLHLLWDVTKEVSALVNKYQNRAESEQQQHFDSQPLQVSKTRDSTVGSGQASVSAHLMATGPNTDATQAPDIPPDVSCQLARDKSQTYSQDTDRSFYLPAAVQVFRRFGRRRRPCIEWVMGEVQAAAEFQFC